MSLFVPLHFISYRWRMFRDHNHYKEHGGVTIITMRSLNAWWRRAKITRTILSCIIYHSHCTIGIESVWIRLWYSYNFVTHVGIWKRGAPTFEVNIAITLIMHSGLLANYTLHVIAPYHLWKCTPFSVDSQKASTLRNGETFEWCKCESSYKKIQGSGQRSHCIIIQLSSNTNH